MNDRRRFLVQSLVAGAAITLPFGRNSGGLNLALAGDSAKSDRPGCNGDGDSAPKRPKLEFLVVTDTHLGYKDQDAARVQWQKTCMRLAAEPGRLVLHLGDVVDGGREPQYAIYRELRDKIGKPVHEIPGNHDPVELFEKHVRRPIDTTVDLDWLRLVLVNNSRVDSHDGFLSPAQLDWLEQQLSLAARDDKRLIVAMHVPAHKNLHPDRGWYVKPADGQTRLYELLGKHPGRVLALFHGHFHNGLRGWTDHPPCHEICFPSALYNLDRQLEKQNAPGYNPVEFRPGFTRVTVTSETLSLEYQPLEAERPLERQLKL